MNRSGRRGLAVLDERAAALRRRRIAARETQRTVRGLVDRLPAGWKLHLLSVGGGWVGIEDVDGKCRLACGVDDCGEHLDFILGDGVRS